MKVSIVVPVYNAASFLERNAGLMIDECESAKFDYEIILCDDGSSDATPIILEGLDKKHEKLAVYHNTVNRGLGFTLRHLFEAARGDVVVYLDCDLALGGGIIPQLIFAMGDYYDIVVASRYLDRGDEVALIRRVASRLYFCLCRFLFKIQIKDIGSGAVAIRRFVLTQMNLTANGFGIHAEMYMQSVNLRMKIREIPAKVINTEKGSFSILKHGCSVLYETWKLWYR